MKQEVAKADGLYTRHIARKTMVIFSLLALLVVVAIAVTPLGAASLGLEDTVRAILSKFPFLDVESDFRTSVIIWELRLPRIIMAIICGVGFALSGTVMQGVLRNPLASPFTLGVSSAACFGGTLALILGASLETGSKYLAVGVAFLFGLSTLLLIYAVSRHRGTTPETVILCGVCLMYLFLTMTTLVGMMGGAAMSASYIITGLLVGSSWENVGVIFIFLLVSIPLLLKYCLDLNALALGDEVAQSSGVNLKRLRVVSMVLSTLVVSSVVCFTGLIGFVCLVSPYLARMLMGNDYRLIFPCAAIIGALFLLGTDTLGRTIGGAFEIPVGLLTTLIGIPFLLYLALRRGQYEA